MSVGKNASVGPMAVLRSAPLCVITVPCIPCVTWVTVFLRVNWRINWVVVSSTDESPDCPTAGDTTATPSTATKQKGRALRRAVPVPWV